MVELIVNDQDIDILDTQVTYVMQVNDLSDVTTVNSSYSHPLTSPKTPSNTRAYQNLGTVGDTSNAPYRKNKTQLKVNGVPILTNGISYPKETSDIYKNVVQDGIVDFFRSIENKTIGRELDLSELTHTKNDASIIASFTNPVYRYLLAEYNGGTIKNGGFNPDYQIPSVNWQYLFDKVMDYAGYTYSNMPDLSDSWITYPNPPSIPTNTTEDLILYSGYTKVTDVTNGQNWRNVFVPQWTSMTTLDPNDVQLINNWRVRVLNTGNYRIQLDMKGTMRYRLRVPPFGIYAEIDFPIKWRLLKNGVELFSVIGEEIIEPLFLSASANDVFEFVADTLTSQDISDVGQTDERVLEAIDRGDFLITQINSIRLDFRIYSLGFEYFDFSDAFKDYSMTEFIKEIMFRKSLTPFPNVNEKHIDFKTFSERIDKQDYIDYSEHYGKRTSEIYEFGSYAKLNGLTLRHDEDENTFGDGSLVVDNDNLKDNITLFQSRFNAPSEDLIKFSIMSDQFFYQIKVWDREVRVDDGVQTVEYKPLKNRFFLLKEQVINRNVKIGNTVIQSFPKAIIAGTMMSDVVDEYYSDWGKVFNNLRIHNITLKINEYHIATLDLSRVYYISQQKSYYILNKLIYKSGELAQGEFLKINY